MALSESGMQTRSCEARIIEGLALALDIGIMIYDRNDRLIAATSQFLRFFDVSPDLLAPGARLRDLFTATFDAGGQVLGSLNGKPRHISREDWIAERIAVHWRERYESVERLPDGRWVRLCKRRMADGVLIATIADVTAEKHQEAELSRMRHQAELAQHILNNLANPVMVKDSKLCYVVVNDAFCRIPGLHPKQVLGRTAGELVAPQLAARFERIEGAVLETGVPYEATEDIYRADGSVMHAITRVRRSGTPGNYYVTISFDDVSAFLENGTYQPESTTRYDKESRKVARWFEKPAASASPSTPMGRVLILDEDSQRAATRVTELKKAGSDAVAIANADEVRAFLDAALSVNMMVSDVEVTTEMAKALSGVLLSGKHGILKQAIERKLGDAPPPKPAATQRAAPAQSPDVPAGKSTKPNDQNLVAGSPRSRIRVLVAEDNDVNEIVFEQILEGIGVGFRIVSNGQEAVAAWQAAVPDLILMDISMPGMNGLQATQAIRDAEAAGADKCAHVPIIAMTAHAMSGDKERCFAAGMDDYLSKPVSPEKLESIIEKWIGGAD